MTTTDSQASAFVIIYKLDDFKQKMSFNYSSKLQKLKRLLL